MIQRIQSLYLSLTTIISLIFLKGSFLTFFDNSGSVIKVTFEGIIRHAGTQSPEFLGRLLPVSSIIVLLPVLSMITIFLFKNRRSQMLFTLAGIMLSILLILFLAYYSYTISSRFTTSIEPGWKMCLPVLILFFYILAYKGIKKDDNLIKSYDRIR